MQLGWIILLLSSLSLLLLILVRTRSTWKLFKYAIIQLVISGFILYFLNLLNVDGLNLPINLPTVITVGILGVPGLVTLIALRYVLFF